MISFSGAPGENAIDGLFFPKARIDAQKSDIDRIKSTAEIIVLTEKSTGETSTPTTIAMSTPKIVPSGASPRRCFEAEFLKNFLRAHEKHPRQPTSRTSRRIFTVSTSSSAGRQRSVTPRNGRCAQEGPPGTALRPLGTARRASHNVGHRGMNNPATSFRPQLY